MIKAWVELSLENLELARAELVGALGGIGADPANPVAVGNDPGLVEVEFPDASSIPELAARLGFARRILWPGTPVGPAADAEYRAKGAGHRSAAFRPLRGGRSPLPTAELHSLATSYKAGGGRIDLTRPERRFWLVRPGATTWTVAEEFVAVDRDSIERRRMPKLAYQRPVSLPPRRARAAANLAGIRRGDRVIDPFVGTGALLLEAALLGARVSGVDRDAEMVRGTLRNLAMFGVAPDQVVVGDAGVPFDAPGGGGWDALVTDPPYGRASGSGGEDPGELLRRVVPTWTPFLGPKARVVIVVPGGEDPLGPPWERTVCVPDRVHRSLTREFRVFRRPPTRP